MLLLKMAIYKWIFPLNMVIFHSFFCMFTRPGIYVEKYRGIGVFGVTYGAEQSEVTIAEQSWSGSIFTL